MAYSVEKHQILSRQLYQASVILKDLYDFALYLDNINSEDNPTSDPAWVDIGGLTTGNLIDAFQTLNEFRDFMDGTSQPVQEDRLQEIASVIATEFQPVSG